MENAKVSNKRLMSLAILFVSALEMGGMGLQPALADIAAAFPDIPTVWMQEMSNWPGFAMLLGCALSTLLATKVSKKTLCQIGVGFVVAYAVLGFTLHTSFIQLMMWQTISASVSVSLCPHPTASSLRTMPKMNAESSWVFRTFSPTAAACT